MPLLRLRYPPALVRSPERVNDDTLRRRKDDEADARERAELRREQDQLRREVLNKLAR